MFGGGDLKMLAGAGGRVDPQEQIDLAGRLAYLALHLPAQHEESLSVGQRKTRDRGDQILPLDLRRVADEDHDVRLVVSRGFRIELLDRAAHVLTELAVEWQVLPEAIGALADYSPWLAFVSQDNDSGALGRP